MKKLLITSLLLCGVAFSGFAQSKQVKVIALMNKASWCTVCKVHGMHFMKNIAPMVMKNPEMKMEVNDLSNDQTRATAKEMLEKDGIWGFAKENDATGRVYFLDAKSKKMLSSVSIAEPDMAIMKAYKSALAKSE